MAMSCPRGPVGLKSSPCMMRSPESWHRLQLPRGAPFSSSHEGPQRLICLGVQEAEGW